MPAAERGAIRIAERVVAKVAAQAAREALRSHREGPPLPPGVGGPHASVVVRRPPGDDGSGGQAHIRVAVELGYPSDIGGQCAAVRHQVVRRVAEMVGMEASHVAVEVDRLHSAQSQGEPGRVR
ncbi:Asp23/Gls24 family envelope stress response protein [Streptomyces sodiiphilus]|uniref:Asp23/Gls24 family envelope stress response protein n=1 Tax=Streptomyces sodiiphilus TaxID=226217 RepID=UPI0031CFA26D